MTEEWLWADDIAANLSVTNDTRHTWIAESAMPSYEFRRLWKFHAIGIDGWVISSGASPATRE